MKTFFLACLSVVVLGIGSTACSSSVSCDGAECGAGGASGGAATNSGSGGSVASAPAAVIYGVDPVTVRIATFALDCNAPAKPAPYDVCGWWQFELTLPASMLVPGVVAFTDPAIRVSESETVSSGGNTCGGGGSVSGGGPGMNGQMTITSIDGGEVAFTLDSVDKIDSGKDPNGTYTAPRCQ